MTAILSVGRGEVQHIYKIYSRFVTLSSLDENFPRIMANMVKFNELYQVPAVKWSKWSLVAALICASNPAESFKRQH
jgi:hypothetical protein